MASLSKAGDAGPWRQQAILGRGRWDADALRDVVRDYALEHLGADDAVLVIDETGFLKQGKASCGVGRQYTGSAGKVTNCQIGVFAAYVSARGHAFVDRALYLPKNWTADPARLAAAHVPEGTAFATKPALAVKMIERAIMTGIPFTWVAADAVYGVGDIEQALRRAGKGYVLGVKGDHRFGSWGDKRWSQGPPRRSRANSIRLHGSVCRRAHQRRTLPRLGILRTRRPGRGRIRQGRVRHMDQRAADPPPRCQWRPRLLHHLVSGRYDHRNPGRRGRASLGHRGQLRDRQERAWPRPQRNPLVAWLAPARLARHAGLRDAGRNPHPRQCHAPKKNPDEVTDLIRWSVQEIRRIVIRLAQRCIEPRYVVAWSCSRRAHQAAAQRARIRSNAQL